MSLAPLTFLLSDKQMPLLLLPVRTTIVPLASARVLISPGSTLTTEQLREAGAMTDIVAPSLLHTAGIKAAAAAHPQARLWGPPGAAQKHPELQWHTLGAEPWPYEAELAAIGLDGIPQLNEWVFLHRATKALIVADLLFNIEEPKGLGAWLILNLFGTWKKAAVSAFFLRNVQDPAAFKASMAKLAALDFDHLVPSHGGVLEGDGKTRLIASLRERKRLN